MPERPRMRRLRFDALHDALPEPERRFCHANRARQRLRRLQVCHRLTACRACRKMLVNLALLLSRRFPVERGGDQFFNHFALHTISLTIPSAFHGEASLAAAFFP